MAALVLSSSSCPVGAIVSEELDEELDKYFYKVVCSSKSAQGVGVTRELVLLSVSPFFPAAWTMFRKRQGVGMNSLFGAPQGFNRGGTGASPQRSTLI